MGQILGVGDTYVFLHGYVGVKLLSTVYMFLHVLSALAAKGEVQNNPKLKVTFLDR